MWICPPLCPAYRTGIETNGAALNGIKLEKPPSIRRTGSIACREMP